MDYYIMAFATLLSAVLGLVFSIYSVRKDTDEAKTNALYMLARSLALVLISAIPLCRKNSGFLWLVTLAMLIVQLADGIVDIYIKKRMRTVGPFIMAFIHGICLWSYL